MKRPLFVSALGFVAAATLVASLALPALADGNMTLKNATVESPVPVEVRIGTASETSVPAAYATLNKGDSITLDPTNLQYFWRRDLGSGKWSDWQQVDTRYGNQRVEF